MSSVDARDAIVGRAQHRDGGIGADRRALRYRSLCHRLRDRTHAADGVAPDAGFAVYLAEAVMQQHIGRAGRVGRRIGTDDAVEGERAP